MVISVNSAKFYFKACNFGKNHQSGIQLQTCPVTYHGEFIY